MNFLACKACKGCKEIKPLEDYYPNKRYKDGRLSLCIPCERDRVNTWIKSKGTKEKYRRKLYSVKWKYGITREEYEALLARQKECCLICGIHKSLCKYETLVVDHCHTSGKIRGLLCHHCNAGLGHFKDSTEVLQVAIDYLRRDI